MRADRLLAMVARLQVRGRVTAASLADDLEISLRTVYRDIEALARAGIPVCTEAGPGGGVWLLDGYRSSLTGLTPSEAASLVALAVPGPLNDMGLAGLVADAQIKLLATLPRSSQDLNPRFLLDAPPWFRVAEDAGELIPLVEAVRDQRRVSFTYRGAAPTARPRHYSVDPLGLVNKAGHWYLAGKLDRRVRAFRASRIRGVKTLPESFDRPVDFDLQTFWTRWTEEFEASLRRLSVTVRATPRAVTELPHILGEGAGSAIDAASMPDSHGDQILTLTFESEEAACARLLGLGDALEVIEPDSVRTRLAATAGAIVARYSRVGE